MCLRGGASSAGLVEEKTWGGRLCSPAPGLRSCPVYEQFQRRRKQIAGTLSGGEQQMLAMGRALMANLSC